MGTSPIIANPADRPILPFDPADAVDVAVHEYSIAQYEAAGERYLQTWGLRPCVALSLYDPQTKIGVLAHADNFTHVDRSVEKILDELSARGVLFTRLQVRIVGGQDGFSSKRLANNLRAAIEDRDLNLIEFDVARAPDSETAVTLDLETGKLYDHDESDFEAAFRPRPALLEIMLKSVANIWRLSFSTPLVRYSNDEDK